MTFPYEYNILDWDDKTQANKQTNNKEQSQFGVRRCFINLDVNEKKTALKRFNETHSVD